MEIRELGNGDPQSSKAENSAEWAAEREARQAIRDTRPRTDQ